MRLTVLGRSPSCPNPGGACSGYLVEDDGTAILMDCGTGVVSRLREIYDYRKLSAVLITHMHADHFIDLIPYAYGLKIISNLANGKRVRLILPPGGTQTLDSIIAHWKDLPALARQVFAFEEFSPDGTLIVGSLRITFTQTIHYVPCWSPRLLGEKTLVYSADAGWSEELIEHCRGADLFLAEAALMEKRGVPGEEGHLTAREAGAMAKEAGVRRLILTHFWQEFDQKRMEREASEAFGGPAELAEEWKSYIV